MSRHLSFHPDLADCLLEDRALMAVVVPSLPWLIVTSGNSGVSSGPGGGQGSVSNLNPLPGPPVISIGGAGSLFSAGGGGGSTSIPGVLFAYYGMAYGMAPPNGPSFGGSAIGSGANVAAGGGGSPSGNAVGYGASFNSGYGTSLNALNGYGMTASVSAIGQTSASGSSATDPNQTADQSRLDTPAMPAPGMDNSGGPGIGVDVRTDDTLLRGGLRPRQPRSPVSP